MAEFWWVVTAVTHEATDEAEDILAAAAIESGCIGSQIDRRSGGITIGVWYRSDHDGDHWRREFLRELGGAVECSIEKVETIEDQKWASKCEEGFDPITVGRRLCVLAPWHRGEEPEGSLAIFIKPGSAFGTGYHESTQAALTLLEGSVDESGAPASVIDVGSGSGILSIASIKLGASRALAVDLDPAVMDEIEENAALNAIGDGRIERRTGDLLRGISEKFDLLFANILLEPNVELLPSVAAVLKKNGRAIFSGMTEEQRPIFLAEMEKTDLAVVRETVIGEWWGVLAKAPA